VARILFAKRIHQSPKRERRVEVRLGVMVTMF
jgi:hypothetical protein